MDTTRSASPSFRRKNGNAAAAGETENAMLEVRNLSFRVNADAEGKSAALEIVDNISFTLGKGRILVVTGPNGGGKSTLAKLIMGIEKPSGGQILFEGTDITRQTVTERARLGLGYAFQQPPRFKGVTVHQLLNIASGRTLSTEECCDYLTSVGLCSKDYFTREVDASLSGGELKRIEIATLMARAPKLGIYDEPEAGIDLWSFSMLADSFGSFDRSGGRSIIIISHQERIIRLADEIMILAGGKITAFGPRDEVLPLLSHEDARSCPCPNKQGYLSADASV